MPFWLAVLHILNLTILKCCRLNLQITIALFSKTIIFYANNSSCFCGIREAIAFTWTPWTLINFYYQLNIHAYNYSVIKFFTYKPLSDTIIWHFTFTVGVRCLSNVTSFVRWWRTVAENCAKLLSKTALTRVAP